VVLPIVGIRDRAARQLTSAPEGYPHPTPPPQTPPHRGGGAAAVTPQTIKNSGKKLPL